ncbi:MAG: D-Ala-D-Ala carboxypeptidase family metallohydrolase [Candidatus Methanoperedens sp.]
MKKALNEMCRWLMLFFMLTLNALCVCLMSPYHGWASDDLNRNGIKTKISKQYVEEISSTSDMTLLPLEQLPIESPEFSTKSTVPLPSPPPFNTVITFSEFALGTYISNQYQSNAIIFGGDNPFISSDYSNPTSPVLSGVPLFFGAIEGRFVNPESGNPITVDGFTLDAGYFDNVRSVKLRWYDSTGAVIGTKVNTETGIQKFVISSKRRPISYWRISTIGSEPNGYAIDNVMFRYTGNSCGDERDNIIKEYQDYHIAFIPVCDNFTQSASSANYSFRKLNTGKFLWALVRRPLVVPAWEGNGLDEWILYIGEIHKINSAYRNPAHNANVGGAKSSRHLFGDAADLKNVTRTEEEHDFLARMAAYADADFVEDLKGPCGKGCVHADWRDHYGPYAK